MALDISPVKFFRIGLRTALETSPASSELERLLQNYLLACKVEGKSYFTLYDYRQRVGEFARFAKRQNFPKQPEQITSSHVRAFLLSLQERKLNSSTVNAYHRALQTFFNWLVAEDIINKNPMHNIKPPRIPKTQPLPFSRQDIENLLLLCSGKRFVDVRNKAMVLLFLDTGLRLLEMASIQLDDLNFERETIRVMGKGAKERVVRMGRTAQKALLKYLLIRADDYGCLWLSEERRPLTRHGVRLAIVNLCLRAEVKDAKPGPHTFRHTAAIQCLRNGMGEFTLQLMLGHSTLAMTRRYVSSLGQDDVIKAHKIASPVDNMRLK